MLDVFSIGWFIFLNLIENVFNTKPPKTFEHRTSCVFEMWVSVRDQIQFDCKRFFIFFLIKKLCNSDVDIGITSILMFY